eukprot:13738079-Heterocapsa_arctica.AAC.1
MQHAPPPVRPRHAEADTSDQPPGHSQPDAEMSQDGVVPPVPPTHPQAYHDAPGPSQGPVTK